jgi:hypothetical protein
MNDRDLTLGISRDFDAFREGLNYYDQFARRSAARHGVEVEQVTPMNPNMTTKQCQVYLHLGFTTDRILKKIGVTSVNNIMRALDKEYSLERKAGIPDDYAPTPIQQAAAAYLQGLEGVTPTWLNEF